MRYPLTCRLFGNPDGFAGHLRNRLIEQGATIISTSMGLERRHLEDRSTDVLFLDLHDLDLGAHDFDALQALAKQPLQSRPIMIALAGSKTALDLLRSYAWAAGFDDIFEDNELDRAIERRLNSLALLARAKREAGLRAELYNLFSRDASQRGPARKVADRCRILMIGRASTHQVQIADALPATRIVYAETVTSARAMMDVESFDLVLADDRLQAGNGQETAARHLKNAAINEPSMPLVAISRDPQAMDMASAGGFDDVLLLPMASPILRLRIELWLKIARLQGWQRPNNRLGNAGNHDPSAGLAAGLGDIDEDLVFDRLTGLPGHGFTMEYARLASRHARLHCQSHIDAGTAQPHAILGRIDNLDDFNGQSGYAWTNRLLAKCARLLRKDLRAADFLGYLGNGQFLVVLPLAEHEQANVVAARVEEILRRAEPKAPRGQLQPIIETGVMPLPVDEIEAVRTIQRAIHGHLPSAEPRTADRPEPYAGTVIATGVLAEPVASVTPLGPKPHRGRKGLFRNLRQLEAAGI